MFITGPHARALGSKQSVGPSCRPAGTESPSAIRTIVARMIAEGIQFEWDVARGQMSFFARAAQGQDVAEPDMICAFDDWVACIASVDRRQFEPRLLALSENSTRSLEHQFRVTAPDGAPQWVDFAAVAVRDERGKLLRVVGRQRGLMAAVEQRSTYLPSPFHDPLTGLPNRLLFDRCLANAVATAGRAGPRGFAVLFVDLDGFKAVNDCHGHLIGDRTLVAVAHRFLRSVRPDDLLARRDGDEFTILLNEIDEEDEAATVAVRMLEQLRSPLSFDGTELTVAASIGLALSGSRPPAPEEMLRAADQAMYRAKARGGNAVVAALR